MTIRRKKPHYYPREIVFTMYDSHPLYKKQGLLHQVTPDAMAVVEVEKIGDDRYDEKLFVVGLHAFKLKQTFVDLLKGKK